MSADKASFRCPACDEMDSVDETLTLAPNTVHTEECSSCGADVEMAYDDNGNWILRS